MKVMMSLTMKQTNKRTKNNNCKTVVIRCRMNNLTVKKTAKEQYENIVWDLVLAEQFKILGLVIRQEVAAGLIKSEGQVSFQPYHYMRVYVRVLSPHSLLKYGNAFATNFLIIFKLSMLSMMSYGMEYPFDQFRSAVPAVSPPNFLCTPSLLAAPILKTALGKPDLTSAVAGTACVDRLRSCGVDNETRDKTETFIFKLFTALGSRQAKMVQGTGHQIKEDAEKLTFNLQGWRLNHFPGQLVPMLDNPFSEEKFPNIQSKPPLAQLEAISSRPITCYLGEETDPHFSTASFQVVVESDKVSPQPPLLQAKQSQLPQPLLIRLLLQTLHQLRCPSLDTLQHLNVSLVVGGPKLNTVFEVRPHQCRVQGHDHFPSPAGHTIFDTSQDAIGFLGHLGTLLAHIQAAVNQHPQVLFCLAAFQPLFPKPVALHGVAVAQVQDLALGLVKPHTIDLGPSIQPVQVPLQSLPTLKQINTPTQLGVICKLTEGALDPFVQIIDKDVKQNWPNTEPWGTPLVTGHQPE
ncbi:hypothetical protein QYF61_003479 [Mycteria americana]|uniref:Uncharacterized protein n=1 Tax=Mycteria americana TaxID=33587 RepID=A0AAN7N4W0_MYCAM|nr:hypothetical protein QYF61_003479 [Mycteria americana]